MTERNPESNVLDAIDELVNESLARPIVDDYSVNRYPRCGQCQHDFHGLRCYCGCPRSESELIVPDVIYPRWTMSEGQWTIPINADGVVLDTGPRERRDIDWGINISGDPGVVQGEWESIPDGPPYEIGRDFVLAPGVRQGGREPQWLVDMIDTTTAYVQETLSAISGLPVPEEGGYTLADIEALRDQIYQHRYGGLRSEHVGAYAYQEHFAPQPPTVRLWDDQFNYIATVPQGPPPEPVEPVMIGTRITNVTFYGVVTDGEEPQTMQATLELAPDDGLVLSVPVWMPSERGYSFNEDAATLAITASPETPNLPAVIE